MKYTSLELSKKLADGGCELESEKINILSKSFYDDKEPISYLTDSSYLKFIVFYKKPRNVKFEFGKINIIGKVDGEVICNYYPAYDILNDICVKYAKEFFGTNWKEGDSIMTSLGDIFLRGNIKPLEYYSEKVLSLLQQNKIQEAEDYIWEHCLFNPKNLIQ